MKSTLHGGVTVRMWEGHAAESFVAGTRICIDELSIKIYRQQIYYDCWASAMLLKVEVGVGMERGYARKVGGDAVTVLVSQPTDVILHNLGLMLTGGSHVVGIGWHGTCR